MRVLLQVVKEAAVEIDRQVYSSIKRGVLLFVSFTHTDDIVTIKKTLDKVLSLRVFVDENDKMNLSLEDIAGEVLCVSQFTLYADIKKGRRPSFTDVLAGEKSCLLYYQALEYIKQKGFKCQQGIFGADMKVSLINDGPTTIWIDSEDL